MDAAEALSPVNAGTRLAYVSRLEARKQDLDAAGAMAELSMVPDKQRLLQAQARSHEATAAEKEAEARQQAALLQRLSQGGEAPQDPVERLLQYGNAALDVGAFNVGSQVLQRAGQMAASSASASAAQALAARRKAQMDLDELRFAEGLIAGVETEEDWNRANTQYELVRGQPSPFANIPFRPGRPAEITQSILTAKDRIELGMREAEAKARQANYASQDSLRKARERAIGTAEKLTKERLAVLVKNGGTAAPGVAELREEQTRLTKLRRDLTEAANKGKLPSIPHSVIPEAAKRVAGDYYTTPRGVMRWHPNGWLPAEQAMPPLPRSGAAGVIDRGVSLFTDDEDDDDEISQ